MLTRISKTRSSQSKSLSEDKNQSYYVEEKVQESPMDASSVHSSEIFVSRQVGSSTKQDEEYSLSSTFPRGETAVASCSSSREQSQKVRGNSHIFVLDKHKKPLMPTSPARARELLKKGRAVVVKLYPFTIRLKDRVGGNVQPVRLKLDPGSKTTGVALVRENSDKSITVLWLAELNHRGNLISNKLQKRSALRRRRRSSNLRYRSPRFNNRTKPEGWLAPSLQHRVITTINWVKRLREFCPVSSISTELVRFDTQKLEDPTISGTGYQQGELAGYEIREYLLEKFSRTCCYCDKTDLPLQVDHVHPRSKLGGNRISNLVLACAKCNQKKSNQDIKIFLKKEPERLKKILAQLKKPLRDTAAVNSTRNRLLTELQATGLSVETSSGGRTKWNRTRFGIPKTHAFDAVCVGEVDQVRNWNKTTLSIKCCGRGSHQRTRLDSYGFPRGYLTRSKSVKGFQTGDMVKAVVSKGKKTGTYTGKVAVRATGSFNIQTKDKIIQGINWKNCIILQRSDGYSYDNLSSQSPKGNGSPDWTH